MKRKLLKIARVCAGAGALLCLLGLIGIAGSIDHDRISLVSGIALCGVFLAGFFASVLFFICTSDD